MLRAYPQGETIDGSNYPSLAALLVGHYDAAAPPFRVDFGIDMRRIPGASVADILSGTVDPAKLRGKKVIVGATAIELGSTGSRYPSMACWRASSFRPSPPSLCSRSEC